jgi:hypothetical protein
MTLQFTLLHAICHCLWLTLISSVLRNISTGIIIMLTVAYNLTKIDVSYWISVCMTLHVHVQVLIQKLYKEGRSRMGYVAIPILKYTGVMGVAGECLQ